MMAQWHACRKSAPGAILLFRLGDFYEAFHDDAVLIAKELDLTLTKRQEVPMAGVPFHSAESYIDRLVSRGHRIAIAEQMEDPRAVKGLVKREIVRIITPGTVVNSLLLAEKSNNFLACIAQVGEIHGVAILDLTTADFRAMEFDDPRQLADELCRLFPKEILVSEKWHKKNAGILDELKARHGTSVTVREDWHFNHAHACDLLSRHFQVHSLDGFGLKGMIPAINTAGALLHYLREDLNLCLDHITTLATEQPAHYMQLDRMTQKNLELVESFSPANKGLTLLKVLDHTATPMGGRLLKRWLTHPLLDPAEIFFRQDGIADLLSHSQQNLQESLGKIRDLERLMMRIGTGFASPRDLAGLRDSLEHIAPLAKLLDPMTSAVLLEARENLSDVSSIVNALQRALVDAPPLRLGDGGIFRPGFHEVLDQLQTLQTKSHSWVADYQTRLKEETHIKTLKVGYTKAFGYYIEVSRGAADRIPETFQRRQTLTNAERFTTPELKEFEHQMLHREEKVSRLEQELFETLRKEISHHAPLVRQIAGAVAQIDALSALALAAKKGNYTRPIVDNSGILDIRQGRHPVIEASLSGDAYIPNDVFLDNRDNRLWLITGPNMAGKSTFIRQVALIAILAQMGSFVPAQNAHVGIIDRVFSRIGASDDLSRGQSTFMVEMTETANILHHASDRSLVILDEIGRGTSTYDGISIAWAVAEYLLSTPGKMAKTLFATHYWELTELENTIPGALNYNVAVQESVQGIVFLRKIVKGGTDKSYGIHVAKLAGLPLSVIKRAEAMLSKLEKDSGRESSPKAPRKKQMSLFDLPQERLVLDPHWDAIRSELEAIDCNHLTPMEALQKLSGWKRNLKS